MVICMDSFDDLFAELAEGIRLDVVSEVEAQLAALQSGGSDRVEVIVGGQDRRPLASLALGETVELRPVYLRQIVEDALTILGGDSPVLTGRYRASHASYVDGQKVADLLELEAADSITIAADLPYARLVERHAGRRVPWSRPSEEEGPYHDTVARLCRAWGTVASITFAWMAAEIGEGSPDPADLKFPAITISRLP